MHSALVDTLRQVRTRMSGFTSSPLNSIRSLFRNCRGSSFAIPPNCAVSDERCCHACVIVSLTACARSIFNRRYIVSRPTKIALPHQDAWLGTYLEGIDLVPLLLLVLGGKKIEQALGAQQEGVRAQRKKVASGDVNYVGSCGTLAASRGCSRHGLQHARRFRLDALAWRMKGVTVSECRLWERSCSIRFHFVCGVEKTQRKDGGLERADQ